MRTQWVLVGVLAAALAGGPVAAQHQTPNQQPLTTDAANAPTGEMPLGSVRLPRAITADGSPLPAGTYQVRLTAQPSKPDVVGQTEMLERWVEFHRGGKLAGREVVVIVPESEIKMVVKDNPPPVGQSKVQILRGNDYMRVWINRGGTHYLMHFPIDTAAKTKS